MKKHLLLFITMICFASSQNLQAQRYLTEIFDSCDSCESGGPVEWGGDAFCIDSACFYFTWPTDDEGDSDSAFVLVVFAASELAGIAEHVC